MKRASVAVAMNKGKWEESEDFRAQLKDEDEAQALEQQAKSVTDAKGLEDLIRQTYEKVEIEPANLTNYRQLADYYQRYGDLENAIAWIQEARKQEAGQGDVSLEEKERELTLEYFDNSINQWHQSSSSRPYKPRRLKILGNRLLIKKSCMKKASWNHWFRDIQMTTVTGMRLGVNLFENEDYENCLSHFQLAQRNAKVRLDAILYLGRPTVEKIFTIWQLNSFPF